MMSSDVLLRLNEVEVAYNRVIHVLRGVSLAVPSGSAVALLGANGAGKSTALKAISNLLLAERGRVTKGSVEYAGRRIDGLDPADVVQLGIAHVMEGRRLFPQLTVEENLRTGAFSRKDSDGVRQDLERILEYFPRLRERRTMKAGYLSGGEQQMAALGRGLMARPKLMLLDEPSMGLAPLVVKEIFEIIARLRESEGVSILLAEQNAAKALAVVDYGYVLENGAVVLEGPAAQLRENDDIRRFYLGLGVVAEHRAGNAPCGVPP
jgi:branched-chain amino acid transport system ATP-binding protein